MDEWASFLASRRSPVTRRFYQSWGNMVLGDPVAFLKLAREDRPAAERTVLEYVLKNRGRVSGATLRNYLAAVRSYLDFYEVPFGWRRLKALCPPAKVAASDRAPEKEELVAMWKVADVRERLVMSFLVSLGGRRGAFWFPSMQGRPGWMKMKHVTRLDDGTASIVIYPGEPEEYRTLVSPEAVQQLDLCLELRERVGEKIGPDSPVLRNWWHSEYAWHPEEARPLTAESVTAMLRRLKMKAGITTNSHEGGFKAAHGFRKFFKSNFPACPHHGPMEAEALLGHRASYDKLPWEHVRERYRAAVPYLVIDEKFRLQTELKAQEERHESEWTRTRLELLEMKEKEREWREAMDDLRPYLEELKRRRGQPTEGP